MAGCDRNSFESTPPEVIPLIQGVSIRENAQNVVSAIMQVNVVNASTVEAEYGTDTLSLFFTPTHSVHSSSVTIPIVGLHAGSTYWIRVKAVSSTGNSVRSAFRSFTTDSLPADLPMFTISVNNNPAPGFVMLGLNTTGPGRSYAVIVDNAGTVVFYRVFDGAVADFQKQPHGHYTAWASLSGEPARFHDFDNLGNITGSFQATGVEETGPHELRVRPDGHLLFGVEYRTMDLTAHGGLATATVRGLRVEYVAPQPFVWNTFDHFGVADAMPDISLTGQNVNPWHGNAIDVDTDGHLLVSFRNMDEVTKINSSTGEIIWRLGGRNNEFTFVNDPLNGFSHQHGIRRLSNGNIILFDNGNLHSPPASRAVEYHLDEAGRIATMIWEYRPQPLVFASFLGFAERISNGNTLICFGNTRRVIEVDSAGTKRWDLFVNNASRLPYRAFRIPSLY